MKRACETNSHFVGSMPSFDRMSFFQVFFHVSMSNLESSKFGGNMKSPKNKTLQKSFPCLKRAKLANFSFFQWILLLPLKPALCYFSSVYQCQIEFNGCYRGNMKSFAKVRFRF